MTFDEFRAAMDRLPKAETPIEPMREIACVWCGVPYPEATYPCNPGDGLPCYACVACRRGISPAGAPPRKPIANGGV